MANSESTTRNLRFVEHPTMGEPSSEPLAALKTKAWLRGMIDQGEDRIWRGAEVALQYVIRTEIQLEQSIDALTELVDAAQLEADGEMGISAQLTEALLDARTALARIDAMWTEK